MLSFTLYVYQILSELAESVHQRSTRFLLESCDGQHTEADLEQRAHHITT